MRENSIIRSAAGWREARWVRVGVGLIVCALLVGVSAADAWNSIGSSKASATAGPAARTLENLTACEVFTLAEAKTLIGAAAIADPRDSHALDIGGQRNAQCTYSSGQSGLAELQTLIPLTSSQAKALKAAFASNKMTFQGTSVRGIGAAAFWKTKVGVPALYVLTRNDVMFNISATTNGTNSSPERRLARVATAIVRALGAASTGNSPSGTGQLPQPPKLPAPPRRIGCYRHSPAGGWQRINCVAGASVERRFGIPLAGTPTIQQGVKLANGHIGPVGPPVALSQMDAFSLLGSAVEHDSKQGAGAFSLQDNTNVFTGDNHQFDWVQFVYDTSNGGTSGDACIWQIDLLIPDHNGYDATGCVNINSGSVLCCIEGLELPGLLVMAVSDLGGSAVAAVQPDIYGLEDGDNWNLAAGSILGVSFSQAVFASGTEEQIALNASSCESFGGFITFPLPCGTQGLTGAGPPLKPDAFSTWPLFGGTAETNNLQPVIGSPPKHLPKLSWSHGGHVATVIVTETRSGHCVHGSPPRCT